jgi:hypothetical protein
MCKVGFYSDYNGIEPLNLNRKSEPSPMVHMVTIKQ